MKLSSVLPILALLLSTPPASALPSLPQPSFSFDQLFARVVRALNPWAPADDMHDVLPFLPLTPHPWLAANAGRLARLPGRGAARQLCNASSPLYLAPGAGATAPPADLFACLEISTNRDGRSESGWAAAHDVLAALAACPPALAAARRLRVDIYITDYVSGRGRVVPPPPPARVLRGFTDLLPRLPGLEELVFGVPPEHAAGFSAALAEAGLQLPGVRRLTLGRGLEGLVALCPGVEELAGGGYTDHWSWNTYVPELPPGRAELVKAAAAVGREKGGRVEGPGGVKALRLHMGSRVWEEEGLLELVVESLPGLETLEMEGPLARPRGSYYLEDWEEFGESPLEKTLSQLARLPNLKHLTLPSTSDLGLGFDGGAWCGNAYFGAGGRAYGRDVIRQSVAVAETASNLTMAELPRLESLSIGWSKGNITRGEDGSAFVSWPWSGGLEAYAFKQYPL